VNRLSDLPIKGRAEIVQVEGTDEVSLRLLEMGLTPGASVVCVGTAPLGDPLEFEVRGYRLSVRRSEAQKVIVRPN
jgi:ferrous iron transport protein A